MQHKQISYSELINNYVHLFHRFQDKLNVNVVRGSNVTIPVHAYGFGSTIVTEPVLAPNFDLGPHFAKSKCVKKIKLTNRGRRHHALIWGTDGFIKPKHTRRDTNQANAKDMKIRVT